MKGGGVLSRTYNLERWIDMNALGWFSGDTHVHRLPKDMLHLMEAEDLNVAPVISFWNQRHTFEGARKKDLVVRNNRAFSLVNQEDERGGGAIMGLNLEHPVQISTTKWHPSQARIAREWRKQGATIEQEKPFWWEAPVNVALGLVDTVGIANNHLQRTEVMENEAWGRPRDHTRYPGKEGFLHNVLDLYYRYLNLGIKIPVAAGSASGVLRNPLGFNRLYVKMDAFGYHEWFEGMRAGRAFATNGPMLFFEIDGQVPALTIKSDSPGTYKLSIEVRSRGMLDSVEIVRNGKVERSLDCHSRTEFRTDLDLRAEDSCWVAARAFEKSRETVVFAHSNPVFLEVQEPIRASIPDAQFYMKWCRDLLEDSRRDRDRYSLDDDRNEVEGAYRRAISFYEKLAEGGV